MNRATAKATAGATPTPPLPPVAPDDQLLLATWFDSTDPISEISRQHKLSLRQIAAWAKRPDIAEIITSVRELYEERAELQLTLAAHDAIVTLKFVTITERPSNAHEIARRAAEGILSRCRHLRPEGVKAVANNPEATPTPSPTSPHPESTTLAPTEPRVAVNDQSATQPIPGGDNKDRHRNRAAHPPHTPLSTVLAVPHAHLSTDLDTSSIPSLPQSRDDQNPGDRDQAAPPRETLKPPAPQGGAGDNPLNNAASPPHHQPHAPTCGHTSSALTMHQRYTPCVSGEPQSIQVNFGKPMPIFPLNQVTLLPQQVLPLNIFEPRYRQMVEHALDGAGQIAMAVFDTEAWREDYHARPPVKPAVCIGQIVQHEKLDDGRYNLLLQGVCRARIVGEDAPSGGRLYRTATLEPVGLDDENDPTALDHSGTIGPDASSGVIDEDELSTSEFEPSEHSRRPDPAELVAARKRIEEMLTDGELSELRVAEPVLEYVRNEDIPASALMELVSFTIITDLDVRYALLAEPSAFRRAKVIVGELSHIESLIRRAKAQHPEQWPKGCSWN